MLFAAGLVLEREPLQWSQLFVAVNLWLQNAGSVAAVGLAFWMLLQMVQRRSAFGTLLADAPRSMAGLSTLMLLLACLSFIGYLAVGLIGLGGVLGASAMMRWMPLAGHPVPPGVPPFPLTVGDYVLSVSGLLALAVALTPMLFGMLRLRVGRIWALARLSLKEAVRSRVVLVFAFMALVFLFADWFVPYHRAEDQVRNYVRVVYWSMTPLFLMTAGLLGALSIPADIKSQSIHTIVTKPVEKFEIVLGRFLGYGILLTTGLAAVSLLSLIYVDRGVNHAANHESYTARVPIFGSLEFIGTANAFRGENVGREYDYRGYIAGPGFGKQGAPRQYASWTFDDVPAALAARDEPVTVEFTFDIFRLSKGEENKDIPCTFTFADGSRSPAEINQRLAEIELERGNRPAGGARDAFEDEVIARDGIYEAAGIMVTDYHTQKIEVPLAFFKKLLAADAPARAPGTPRLRILVSVDRVEAGAQMLGAARRDLYLLANERPFWQNFLKGIVGMWCTHMLVLGIAVALSTYLSGLIAWACTMFLFGAGMFTEHLQKLAEGRMEGGGPAEALLRVTTGRVMAAQLDASPATSVLRGADAVFSWWLRRVLNLVPDVNRFDLQPYVAYGFDVPISNVLVIDNLIPLVGYLLPWAILAYYMMKYREIANPT
jgi:hypothetical protein